MEDLRWFIPSRQAAVIKRLARGEEKSFFHDKVAELHAVISAMPVTYEQDGKGGDAVAYLHYFGSGSADVYVTERDMGKTGKRDFSVPQIQASGLVDLYGDGGEIGYINLREIAHAGLELDLHFEPQTLRALRPQKYRERDVVDSPSP